MNDYQTDTTGAQYWQPTPRETPEETMRRLIAEGHRDAEFYAGALALIEKREATT